MKIIFSLAFIISSVLLADIKAVKTETDLSKALPADSVWKDIPKEPVSLVAQYLVNPKPKVNNTPIVEVQAIHDGAWLAFKLTWKADSKNEGGKTGQYSDAVAIQFPMKEGTPPLVFMGSKGDPVYILHWRAQYQRDVEKGKPSMKDLYPGLDPDMYPMEFKYYGNISWLTDAEREVYSPAKVLGNPQSFQKRSSVDEIIAEGFGTSAVVENKTARGFGVYDEKQKTWSVVISTPLAQHQNNFVAFAVWQGGKNEVGCRKSVVMNWVPLQIRGQT